MTVYDLNYKDGKVSIPNKELMDMFAEMIQKEASPGYVCRLEQRRYTGRNSCCWNQLLENGKEACLQGGGFKKINGDIIF